MVLTVSGGQISAMTLFYNSMLDRIRLPRRLPGSSPISDNSSPPDLIRQAGRRNPGRFGS